jgi:dTDP-4-amino-4,6-dideoxygalactose transaminase
MKKRTGNKKFIHFHRSSLYKEERREVIKTLKSGWITTGPRTKRFEEEFKNYIGCRHAIGVNSCTAGLHLSLAALNISEGDEVITTPITFPATANVIIHQRGTPVFVDVEMETLNMDVSRIEERITKKTKAIMPVHFAGHPCDMDKITDIAKRHNLFIIEDAAHAIESIYNGKKIGNIADFTSFSFYATKNITTGEGGMLTTNNDEMAEKSRIMSLHGISKDAWKRYGRDGYQHWELFYPGFKYNMFDIQAAIGIHQLKRIDNFLEKRKRYVEMYNDAFKDIPEIVPLKTKGMDEFNPPVSPLTPPLAPPSEGGEKGEVKGGINGGYKIRHAHHLYVIIIRTEELKADRDKIMHEIQLRGVGVGVHFRTLHLQPYYQNKSPLHPTLPRGGTGGFEKGMFPVAEYVSDRVISLPLYPKMTISDVKYVIKVVNDVITRFRK